MGLAEYSQAVELMNKRPEVGADFVGPRTEALVEAAERALGFKLSATYRRFVREFGAGNFGAFEVYGVIDENFDVSSVPDGIWLTLRKRATLGLPNNFLIVGADGMGGYYCLNNDENSEDGEVIVYYPGVVNHEKMANSFGEFFLLGIQDQIEFFEEDVDG